MVIQNVAWYQAFIVYKNPESKIKKHIFPDLAKSGRSGFDRNRTGTGPELNRNRTGTGPGTEKVAG